MRHETISLDQANSFSSFFIDYIQEKPELKPFYKDFPSLQNARKAMEAKELSAEARQVLVYSLNNQYQDIQPLEAVSHNLTLLKEPNTYTVTTGHQLNIFTGPLYFIYKLVTAVNACKQLKKAYPDSHFVPIYWMASEDHDFEEISHFSFDGKKHEWKSDQKGAVGRMDPSELLNLCKKLPDGATFFAAAYQKDTLAEAVRHYVNHLFGKEGLVVIDADDSNLKRSLIPVIEDDLFVHSAEDLVAKTSASLDHLGYKTQATARRINFFYLDHGVRERFERVEEGFQVLNTSIRFSEEEMRNLIEDHPEKFSPNVILRPLYQEMILPNIAYIGGPSEGIYWLQLKAVFDHFKTPFPMVMPRNFATIIPRALEKKWEKIGFQNTELFEDTEKLIAKWVKAHSSNKLSYEEEIKALAKIEEQSKKKAEAVDPTLSQHLEAIHARFAKRLHLAENKLIRAEKRNHTDKRQQIKEVKEVLFPNGSLQERHQNLLTFYLDDPSIIQSFLDTFDAFDYRMYLLWK